MVRPCPRMGPIFEEIIKTGTATEKLLAAFCLNIRDSNDILRQSLQAERDKRKKRK